MTASSAECLSVRRHLGQGPTSKRDPLLDLAHDSIFTISYEKKTTKPNHPAVYLVTLVFQVLIRMGCHK